MVKALECAFAEITKEEKPMNHTTKPASGLLVLAILATVVLSACLPLPATTVPSQTQEVAAPGPAETTAPQVAETAAPEESATATPQATEPVTQAAPAAGIEGTLWTLVSYAGEEGENI